jgi:hypothetical protein
MNAIRKQTVAPSYRDREHSAGAGIRSLRPAADRLGGMALEPYSHSIVAGGLLDTS